MTQETKNKIVEKIRNTSRAEMFATFESDIYLEILFAALFVIMREFNGDISNTISFWGCLSMLFLVAYSLVMYKRNITIKEILDEEEKNKKN